MFALILLAVFVAAVVFGLAYFIQGPPYVASSDADAAEILEEVKRVKPTRVLDMGSGNGKLVIHLAKHGVKADGVELNPLLVLRSRRAVRKAGLSGNVRIYWGNFWKFNTAQYDLVVLYAIKHVMPRLESKLTNELSSGAHIVSNYFVFPNLKPIKKTSRLRVYRVK